MGGGSIMLVRRKLRLWPMAGLLGAFLAGLAFAPRLAAAEPAASAKADDSCAEPVGLMYWTRYSEGVYRACRDGTKPALIVPIKNVDGLAVDEQGGKLYFTVSAAPARNSDSVYRANLDGTSLEEVMKNLDYTGDLAIDAKAGKLYVSCMGAGKIVEARLDGTQQKDLIVGQGNPDEMTIDLIGRKIYWVRSGVIRRADLDGGNVEEFAPIYAMTMGLAVDTLEQRLYYVVAGDGSIRRIKLDGTGDEQIVDNHFNTDGLALDPYNRKLYWTEETKVCQANLDGTLVETLVADKTSKYASIVILPPKEAK